MVDDDAERERGSERKSNEEKPRGTQESTNVALKAGGDLQTSGAAILRPAWRVNSVDRPTVAFYNYSEPRGISRSGFIIYEMFGGARRHVSHAR